MLRFKQKIQHLLDYNYRFVRDSLNGKNQEIPDKEYLEKMYRGIFGKKLDLNNPKRYTEKIQWLKLYDRNPLYSDMVDKYKAKKLVSELIGNDYVIPTIGVWNSFDEIDFDKLPNRFVLKCNHDSGSVVICKDKSSFNINEARKVIDHGLRNDFWRYGREWPYKNVEKKIIAEQYVDNLCTGELSDYKFFVFNGKVRSLFVATERQSKKETKFDFYDEKFNHLPIINGHPNSSRCIVRPKNFELMEEIAEKLSGKIPHVRIDLYNVDGHIYFGEFTFYHFSGFVPFYPTRWDYVFGEWIDLHECK